MGLFRQARQINKVSREYRSLAGIRDERSFQSEVDHLARTYKTSMSEVMGIGVAALRVSDSQPKPNTIKQWPTIMETIADQVLDGTITFSDGTPVSKTVSVEDALKIAHAVLQKHRSSWRRLGFQDQLQREYAILYMEEDRDEKMDARMTQIEGWMATDFGGASALVEEYLDLVKSGDLRFEK